MSQEAPAPTHVYHFSDRGDIEIFVPRPPIKHPDSEPLVYSIDEWHSPLYLFPRDCPRIAVWPLENSTPEHLAAYYATSAPRMRLFIDRKFETAWREGSIYRYTFDPDGFGECNDHGVRVCRHEKRPIEVVQFGDLEAEATRRDVEVYVADSLADAAKEFYDFDRDVFTSSLHVSMIRMSLLPDWPGPPPTPKPKYN